MKIRVENLTHKFRGRTLFQNMAHDFESNSRTAILGDNGSGKSTYIKILSGFLTPTEGTIYRELNDEIIELDKLPIHVSACTPFLTLENQFSLSESFDFHYKFKSLKEGVSKSDFFNACFLESELDKKVGDLSSGMTQRLKLTFSMLSQSDLILLDEPCSNLDEKGRKFYLEMIEKFCAHSTIIVASNSVESEIRFCNSRINLSA